MEKECKCCKQIKLISEFAKRSRNKDRYDSNCKECRNLKNKNYRNDNKEKVKTARKKYYSENIDKMREEKIKYYKSHKQEKAEYDKTYRLNNKEKIKLQKKNWENRNKNNINLKLKRNLRRRLNHFISGTNKSKRTLELLGCSFEEFKIHISSLFSKDMTWDNYGQFGWHIDHILPCDSFDLFDPLQQEQCFNYKNLQPLWWQDNLKKSNKI